MVRTLGLAIFGLAILIVLGAMVLERAKPAEITAYFALSLPIMFLLLASTAMLRGERDSLRLYEKTVELPTRSRWEALRGKPNTVINIDTIANVYLPFSDPGIPFIGFELGTGEVVLVHREHASDLDQLRRILTTRGVPVVPSAPPVDRVSWKNLPWWLKGPDPLKRKKR